MTYTFTPEELEILLRKAHSSGYDRGYFDGTGGFTYDQEEQTEDVDGILENIEED